MEAVQFIKVERRSGDHVILPSLSFSIDKGARIGVYTSLERRRELQALLIGQQDQASGDVKLFGKSIHKKRPPAPEELGILFLDEGYYERLNVKDHLRFYKRIYGSAHSIQDILNTVKLAKHERVQVERLSLSHRRRLGMAKLLIQNPEIFLLEEPDQNVDMETKVWIRELLIQLQNDGKTVLVLTEHMEPAVLLSDTAYHLDEKGLSLLPSEKGEEEEGQDTDTVIRIDKIPAKCEDKWLLFDPAEIDYFESDQGTSVLYCHGEHFPCGFTMAELEERLKHVGFFRCHRSYLVNLQRVREIITWSKNSYSLTLDRKEKRQIPLSKNKMADLKTHLGIK
ncbi:LytTR family transcriptional regulator DNA-binding domain-containing protein [Halobacillus sp. ACCC02827]|uniref:LytTR family transcriptional regulator DNA-binding domain-containing protein n=1 Tax=Halobacillus sp. ACCC02827 TaxID=3052090 RepID=UPI00257046C6|nr:LytTR family transcriptional regulator DNA-binding domain-containing protein [Halobacillus sp. ACCC02827]WJE17265.1 LytTR family transcriptional regulator DNA-binding domain-containing protein [Halobacillus sp. ACCC02827]